MIKRYEIGKHLIIDFFDAKSLKNLINIEKGLRAAVASSGATLLDIKLHQFAKDSGITGFVLLAESHISVHTWPESNFAAIDILMCGDRDPGLALGPLKKLFQPLRIDIREVIRGHLQHN